MAKLLGHSSQKVTLEIYSHLFPMDLNEMAERVDGIRSQLRKQVRGGFIGAVTASGFMIALPLGSATN